MKNFLELGIDLTKIDSQRFLTLIHQAEQLITTEENGLGKIKKMGRLVCIPPFGEAIVVGDIHGDLKSLEHILIKTSFIKKASERKEVYMIFLGDYGDRGINSLEVYSIILNLKILFPDKIVLLQGNHEGPKELTVQPNDLVFYLQKKFRSDWEITYRALSRLYRSFNTAIKINQRCVMLHGGVPSKAASFEDVAYAYQKHPEESHLEEILWSDPAEEIEGTYYSPRGAGRLFGEDVTKRFLEIFGVRFLIRGHEPSNQGYKINHNGKVLTIFSRRGDPYFNKHGTYLIYDLSKLYDSVIQLESSIQKF
jgi:protein phosphatase